jgi:hypothetical protein
MLDEDEEGRVLSYIRNLASYVQENTRGYDYEKEDQNNQKGSIQTLVGGIEGTTTIQYQMVLRGEIRGIISSSPSKLKRLETKILPQNGSP